MRLIKLGVEKKEGPHSSHLIVTIGDKRGYPILQVDEFKNTESEREKIILTQKCNVEIQSTTVNTNNTTAETPSHKTPATALEIHTEIPHVKLANDIYIKGQDHQVNRRIIIRTGIKYFL